MGSRQADSNQFTELAGRFAGSIRYGTEALETILEVVDAWLLRQHPGVEAPNDLQVVGINRRQLHMAECLRDC